MRSKTARALAWERRYHAGVRAFQSGNQPEAETAFQQALREAEGFAASDPRLRASLDSLAGLYRLQGKYAPAEALCLRVLAMKEQTLGHAHPDVAATLRDLVEISRALGRSAQAAAYHERALKILEHAIGPDFAELDEALHKAPGLRDEDSGIPH